ncbi:dTMP kinase [Campylobacter troglodytis]|uniref:dTMP kinase n=1 Tax=Campylobacter troglodytis TaxID=654363 RepID=UPI00115B7EFB|nr:dTMP kinase [Campylobacter troglodytis]TQR61664.1 dTMP kinase [Campylobacter troglodytis]
MYVVIEGVDGVGKSTQIELLKAKFKDAIFSFEPGATRLGKVLREILLEKTVNFSKRAELLLFLADRAEHYEQILRENADKLIISDRSFISNLAYAKSDFEFETLLSLNAFALNDFFPQKCVFLRASEELLKERLATKELDKIEKRGVEYFMSVQARLEKSLEILEKRLNLSILSLDAQESMGILHEKIKDFIND